MSKPAHVADTDTIRSLLKQQLPRTPLYRLIVSKKPGLAEFLLERETARLNRAVTFTTSSATGKAILSVEKKNWESALFGIAMAAVTVIMSDTYAPGILGDLLDQLVDWGRENNVQMLSYRTADIAGTIELKTILEKILLKKGFYKVETYLTFDYDAGSQADILHPATDVETCMFSPEEQVDGNPIADQIRKIARSSFTLSRFHLDPHLDRCQADRSREDWIINILKGRGGCIYSLDSSSGSVNGFIGFKDTTLETTGTRLTYNTIELIAVHPEHHGKAIGAHLIKHYLTVMKRRGTSFFLVGTQAKNVASIRLYEKCLFKLLSCRYTYHWNMRRSR